MELLIQRIVDGVSIGAVYSSMALAISLVYLATGTVNFAQGSMGMLSAFITWKLTAHEGLGWPLILALTVGILAGCVTGAILERLVARPIEDAKDHLPMLILTLGLFLVILALAGYIFTPDSVKLESPFPEGSWRFGTVVVLYASVGIVIVALLTSVAVYLLFARTRIGLTMRAVVDNQDSAQMVGIRTGRIFMLGWALGGGIGAISAILVAPTTLVSPNMMDNVLFFGVAAAALGGFTSPIGSVLGGFVIGLVQTLAPAYVPYLDNTLALACVFLVMLGVLVFKPTGVFGQRTVNRL